MKVIYWRWKRKKREHSTIAKSYIQEDLDEVFELSDTNYWTNYPTRVLKKEIDVIKITKDLEMVEETDQQIKTIQIYNTKIEFTEQGIVFWPQDEITEKIINHQRRLYDRKGSLTDRCWSNEQQKKKELLGIRFYV